MASPDHQDVVTGYLQYAEALSAGVPEESLAMRAAEEADARVRRLIADGPALEAWVTVRDILRAAPDERLGVVAAGPLEDLVRLRGPEVVEAIEVEAARDERFQWALGRIWLTVSELPPDILARVVAASRAQINPLDEERTLRDHGFAT
jgi:uncharacterized protein DUF6869